MTITAEQGSGAQPDWVKTVKVAELSGKHAGMAISLGAQGASLGWSWTVGGLLAGVEHAVANFYPNGSRALARSTVKIMIARDSDQVLKLSVAPDTECQISPATDPGRMHHGMTAA